MSVFLDKARQVSPPQMKTEGETSKDEKPPDPHPDPNTPRKKLAMSDIIIAAAAAKTVKLKSQGIDIFENDIQLRLSRRGGSSPN